MKNSSSIKFFCKNVLRSVGAQTALMASAAILSELAEAAGPWLFGLILESFSSSGSVSGRLFLGLLGAWVVASLFPILYQALDTRVSPRVFKRVQEDLLDRLSRHSEAFFEKRSAGELGQYVRQAATAATTLHNILFFDVIRILVLLTITELLLFPKQPILAGMFLLWVLIYLALSFKISKSCLSKIYSQSALGARTMGRILDLLMNLDLVHVSQTGQAERASLRETLDQERTAQSDLRGYLTKMNLFQAASKLAISIGVSIFAFRQLQAGSLGLGDFVMFVQLSVLTALQVQNISNRLVEGSNQLGILAHALGTIPEVPSRQMAPPQKAHAGNAVVVSDVHFSYPNGRKVLCGLNLHIFKGQKVAIVGSSGSGKSTLFRLLADSYQAKSGRIEIFGRDIASLTHEELFKNVTIVPQTTRIFNRTMAENLIYGTRATEGEGRQMLSALGGDAILRKLPAGLQTPLGEQGSLLSGGERQRVALCRALLRRSPIILLDESLSALDAPSCEQVSNFLREHDPDCTCVMITHRLESLGDMDQIYYMSDGRIAESGTFAQLMARDGLFRQALNAGNNV
ncbi:MAG: hypothetical protein C5B49_08050 [Bdellovibrio sp.]|nr:MAG: hypothetical protein C5B49_08050 [Bdellovibrio sp.]